MRYVFHCWGHKNIRAKHTKTIEFTKDRHLTPRGDCVIGVGADFDVASLRKLSGRIRITVEVDEVRDTFWAWANPDFDDEREMVFRKSRYRSQRTLGLGLNKGAVGLNRTIVRSMVDPKTRMTVILECAPGSKKRERREGLKPTRPQM